MTDASSAPERVRVELTGRKSSHPLLGAARGSGWLRRVRREVARGIVIRTHPDGTEERMTMREALERAGAAALTLGRPENPRSVHDGDERAALRLAAAALSLLLGGEEG